MIKTRILVIFLIFSILNLVGCYESRKGYTERRGLMLLEKHEYARNQGVYKPAKKRKKNISKDVKRKQNGKKKISKANNDSNSGRNSRGTSGLGSSR